MGDASIESLHRARDDVGVGASHLQPRLHLLLLKTQANDDRRLDAARDR